MHKGAALVLLLLLLPVSGGAEDVWEAQVNQRNGFDLARYGDFVYLATAGGVLRLDVRTGALVPILPLDGLASVNVRCTAADRRGNKWFGHGDPDLGVSLLDSAGSWSLISSFEGLQLGAGKKVNTIHAVGDSVWIGTESGATLFESRVRRIILSQEKEGIVSDDIRAILSVDGKIWLGTNLGLSVYSAGTVRNYTVETDSLPAPEVLSLAVDSRGRIWGGTTRGVFRVETGEVTIPLEYSLLRSRRIRSIAFQDSLGADIPWFATDNGPYRKLARKANRETGTEMGDPEDVMKILVDRTGDIWLANNQRWLFRWVETADGWREYTQRGTIPFNHIGDIAVDWSGFAWCPLVGNVEGSGNSPGSRMMVYDGLTWTAVGRTALDDQHAAVASVAIDSLGNRWFGVRAGGIIPLGTLLKVDRAAGTALAAGDIQYFSIDAPDFAAENRAVYNVEVSPDNTKWVAVTLEGFAALDALENRTAWGGWSHENGCLGFEGSSLPVSAIDVSFGADGRVWCALEKNYAASIDFGGTLTNQTDDDCDRYGTANSPLPTNVLYTVRVGPAGRVWFGTQGGLARHDPSSGQWKVYTAQNTGGGLPDNRVRAIAFDRHGNTWAGTFGGGVGVLLQDGETWLEPWTIQSNQRRGSGLTSNEITSLFVRVNDEDEEEIWMATWGGGIIRFVKDWSDRPVIGEPAGILPVLPYPNPYRQGEETADVIRFANVPVGSALAIYDLSGVLVRTIEGRETAQADDPAWDLRNEAKIVVASGVYLFLVKKDGGVLHSGKLAFLR
ncbi:MAG: two-component regulator propeller domain-containing protein [Candidatus Eisenbacteria bacterium]